MTSAERDGDRINLSLSMKEAVVLFEWLSRNWEKTGWANDGLFQDPAEIQMLMWLESDLSPLLGAVFEGDYRARVEEAYRAVVPDPKDWE